MADSDFLGGSPKMTEKWLGKWPDSQNLVILVAQCSATPASVAATPPCSATPLQRQLDVRHSWQFKGDRYDRAL